MSLVPPGIKLPNQPSPQPTATPQNPVTQISQNQPATGTFSTPANQTNQNQSNTPKMNPQDQQFINTARSAGLSDEQIATGLLKKKQMVASGGYNANGAPITKQNGSPTDPNNPNQPTDPFGGRTKQQVLSLAFQSGIHDASSLENIGKTYDLVTGGGTTNNVDSLKADLMNKMTLGAAMQKYGSTMSPDVIVKTYNDNSPWGHATTDSINALKQQGYNININSATSIEQDLRDAQDAINQGAPADAVKKQFLQMHPQGSTSFNNFIQ